MKKPVLLLLVAVIAQMAHGQNARLVINGTLGVQPYIVYNPSPMTAGAFVNEGAYIVIDNPNPDGIWYQPANSATYPGNLGVIRSEAEQNKIRWAIGNTAGTYTIPYADNLNAPHAFHLVQGCGRRNGLHGVQYVQLGTLPERERVGRTHHPHQPGLGQQFVHDCRRCYAHERLLHRPAEQLAQRREPFLESSTPKKRMRASGQTM